MMLPKALPLQNLPMVILLHHERSWQQQASRPISRVKERLATINSVIGNLSNNPGNNDDR